MKAIQRPLFLTILICILLNSCKSEQDNPIPNNTTTGTTTTGGTTTGASSGTDYSTIMTKAFTDYGSKSVSSVTVDGDFLVIKCTGIPDHKSPYFKGTSWENTLYVNDTRSGFKVNPNIIASFSYTFRIPKSPKEATTKKTLGTATIGIALNGVPLFNQYAAGNTPITVGTGEYVSFDLYGGHPAPSSDYHYHVEPNYITEKKGTDALIGFLLDGFPVYGSKENGKTVASASLDAYHGHTSATKEYPNGIYHYHTTADAPFINGNGFFGTAGTWAK